MRLRSTRRLGLALLGVAAIALSPSAFAKDPLADGQAVVAEPAPTVDGRILAPLPPPPAGGDKQDAPASDAADEQPSPPADDAQPPADDQAPAPAPTNAPAPALATDAPAPPADDGQAPAPAPVDDQPPADEQAPAPAPTPTDAPAPAPPPADAPAPVPAPAPADATPAPAPVEPAAGAAPADGAAPSADGAQAPPAPADEQAAPTAPTDETLPPEPPPPPAATEEQAQDGASPAASAEGQAGQAGWGWEAQCIGQYLQCGGLNYWGPTNCCEGHQCEFVNDYWWQCNPVPGWVPPAAATTAPAAAEAPTLAPTRHPHHWGHHHHNHTSVPTVAPTAFPTEAGPPFWQQDCFRVRKNILNLTPEELADFIEALQVLKANGVYDNVTAVHGDPKTFGLFHGNDYFLPWHRWYVLKIETEVRNLGGKWACFAMPYWDWTLDAGREMESPIWNIFGPMGKKNDSFCMREGPWAAWNNSKGVCVGDRPKQPGVGVYW